MLFNRVYDAQVAASPRAAEYAGLQQAVRRGDRGRGATPPRAATATAFLASDARLKAIRAKALGIVKAGDRRRRLQRRQLRVPDLHHHAHADRPGRPDDRGDLRGGDVGQRRRAERAGDGDDHRLLPAAFREGRDRRALRRSCRSWRRSRWGLFACVVAMCAANQGSLIEVVNRYGSFVYGSLLGVFILAILTKRATARGAFWGLIAGMAAVLDRRHSSCRGSPFSGTTSSAPSSSSSSAWRSVTRQTALRALVVTSPVR